LRLPKLWNKKNLFLAETVVFLLALLVFSFFIGNLGFIGVEIHPFYFYILIIVLRYGLRKGLPAIISAAVVYLCLYLVRVTGVTAGDLAQPRLFFSKIFDGSFHVSALWRECYQPLAFILFGLSLGLLVSIDKKKIKTAEALVADQNEKIGKKDKEIKHILKINEDLSHQLINAEHSFNIVFDKTKTLFTDDIQQIFCSLYNILKIIIRGAVFYVYSINDKSLRCNYPEEARGEGIMLLINNKELIAESVKTFKFHYFKVVSKEDNDKAVPYFIGPIYHEASRNFFGLVIIREIDFMLFNENKLRTVRNLCRWVSEILYYKYGKINSTYKWIVDKEELKI
jgi:polysaccharide biosynthesis protein PelD